MEYGWGLVQNLLVTEDSVFIFSKKKKCLKPKIIKQILDFYWELSLRDFSVK